MISSLFLWSIFNLFKMNKHDLIKKVALRGNLNAKEASAIVEVVMNAMVEAILREESVTLVGFGTFSIKMRKARNVLNPSTGENMVIPARKVVKFTPGYKMKLTDKE